MFGVRRLQVFFSKITRNMTSQELDKFGRPYPPKAGKYHIPSLTTDALVVREKEDKKEILLITRGGEPFKGSLAFPGGFLEYNEDPQEGCLRELLEETGVEGSIVDIIDVFGDPQRDTRRHIVTIAYLVKVAPDAVLKAGDDAAEAKFYPLDEIVKAKSLAFDHSKILEKAIKKFSL